jgi:hypothetical protein
LEGTRTSCWGLPGLFSAESLEDTTDLAAFQPAGAPVETFTPCSEAEWPDWFKTHVMAALERSEDLPYEHACSAGPDSLCVHTGLNGDKFPFIYAVSARRWLAENLVENEIATFAE